MLEWWPVGKSGLDSGLDWTRLALIRELRAGKRVEWLRKDAIFLSECGF